MIVSSIAIITRNVFAENIGATRMSKQTLSRGLRALKRNLTMKKIVTKRFTLEEPYTPPKGLAEWLQANTDKTQPPNPLELSKRATKELGFTVFRASVIKTLRIMGVVRADKVTSRLSWR